MPQGSIFFHVFLQAKARASLSWVLCKAYQDKVPSEFHDPFYETGEVSDHVTCTLLFNPLPYYKC